MIRPLLSWAVLAGLGVALCQTRSNSVMLIMPGVFHHDEIAARSGERWIGLAPSSAGFGWRSLAILTRSVQDAVVDDPGQKTGIEVTVPGAKPLFLVRGLDFVGRTVRTALYSPEGLILPDSDVLELRCPNCGTYRLRVVNRRSDFNGPASPSRLILESAEGEQQTIYEWSVV